MRTSEASMSDENIYAPPKANVVQQDDIFSRDTLLRQLKKESTWTLFFLTFITLGIYSAHYIKRQTSIINEHIDDTLRVSDGYINSILILSYVSVLLIIPYFFIEEGHPVNTVSNLLDRLWVIMVLIWAFKARNRMNILLSCEKGSESWFHGFWTFLFQQLYFNYKVNKLTEPSSTL